MDVTHSIPDTQLKRRPVQLDLECVQRHWFIDPKPLSQWSVMANLISALKRTFGGDLYTEPTPHFHQGTSMDFPEVCFAPHCSRPQLKP